MPDIWNAFMEYIKNGNLQKVVELVETNQVDASAQDNQAIIRAAYNGHLEVVQYLLTLPKVDASAQNNKAINWVAKKKKFGHDCYVALF